MTQEQDDHGEKDQLEKEERELERAREREFLLYEARSRVHKNRQQFTTGILFFVFGLISLLLKEDFQGFLFEFAGTKKPFAVVSSLVLLFSGSGILMLLYLRGAISFKDKGVSVTEPEGYLTRPSNYTNDGDIQLRMENLNRIVSQVQKTQILMATGSNGGQFITEQNNIAEQVAVELSDRFSAKALDANHVNEIRKAFANSHDRLRLELVALGFRGNLNLVIGVLTTTLAVGLLAYMVLGNIQFFDSIPTILSYYIPRVSVVLFIEVFSFFFLRLYRTTLVEIRAYQGDITGLALKQIAVEAAWSSSDPAARTALSKDLIGSAKPSAPDKNDSDFSIDPKIITELLQKFGEAITKKAKKGDDKDG